MQAFALKTRTHGKEKFFAGFMPTKNKIRRRWTDDDADAVHFASRRDAHRTGNGIPVADLVVVPVDYRVVTPHRGDDKIAT